MSNVDQAKKIAKEHGIKGFRKVNLKRGGFFVGKQSRFLNQHIAERVIAKLEEAGFIVEQKQVCLELAHKGFLDVITIR